MRRHIAVVAAGVLLGGCGVKAIDPCAAVSGACVGLHLDGSATVTQLDSAVIRVSGGGVDAVKTTKSPKGTAFSLPIAVALSFKSATFAKPTALSITVDGTLGGNAIAGGTAMVTVSGTSHVSAHVTMSAGALPLGQDLGVSGDGGDMATCPGGEHACGGACVSDTSIATCGTMCAACPTDPNASAASCDGTSCGLACNAGFHVCGGACVSDSSADSCNLSCTPCTMPTGGTATCDGTQCGGMCPANQKLCAGTCIASATACNATCPGGTHDCGGLCDSDGSVNSCGASCTPCPVPVNADHAICTAAGSCDYQCKSNYKQCKGGCIPSTGCCDDVDCAQPTNGSATCNQTTHVCDVACNNLYTDCSGMCLPSGNVDSCGMSCLQCTGTQPSNAMPICNGGACDFTCNDHFVRSGQMCVACGTESAACCAGDTCDAPFVCSGSGAKTCQQKALTWSATSDVNGLYTSASVDFSGVWVAGNGTIYVVGSGTGTSNQTIVASSDNGKTWNAETSADGSTDVIKAVTGSSNTAYAVGDHGEIIATSNGTWNKVGCNIGADSSDLYGGVVSSGSLYLWDSTSSVQVVTLSNFTCSSTFATGLMIVYGAWGNATDLYAVGYAPGIIQTPAIKHSTDGGGTFGTDMQPASGGYYSALWATKTGQLYAASSKGLIAHTAAGGKTWTAENTSDAAGNVLSGVWSSDNGGYLYAAGANGIVMQSDGDGTWHGQTSNTTQSLNAVSGNAAGTLVIAVGDHATIVIGQ